MPNRVKKTAVSVELPRAKYLGATPGLSIRQCDEAIEQVQSAMRKEFIDFLNNEEHPPGVRDVSHLLFLWDRYFVCEERSIRLDDERSDAEVAAVTAVSASAE
jgi:hypothetical protein